MPKSSKITFLIISISWLLLSSNQKNWSRDMVKADVVGYYSYLPAVFVDGDITLNFLNRANTPYSGHYEPLTTASGNHLIKYSMGMSVLYFPFFAIAHYVVAPLGGYVRNGYTEAYQACLALGSFMYLFLGLLFLRKTLLLFYTEKITLWVIVSLFFGTNLLWYAYGEALMPHEYIFSLVSLMLYFTIKWYEQPTVKYSVLLGIVCGLIILVRPGDAVLCLFPLLYGELNKNYLDEKIKTIKQNFWKLIFIFLLIVIIQIPQLLYWKTITGNWFFKSYIGENFFWSHPHILEGLFGYRKGWLIYTPMMGFAVIGFLFLKENAKKIILGSLIVFPIFIFMIFCWWSWWYGGSFGMRPMIDCYAILAIPMGAGFTFLMNKRITKLLTILLISFFIVLNMLQIYQYNNFIIHYDSMTKEEYWYVFGKVEKPDHWWENLRLTDPNRAVKGLPEEYTNVSELLSGSYYLRTSENKLLTFDTSGNTVEAEEYGYCNNENFKFITTTGNKFIILATNKKYISLNSENKLVAISDSKQNATEFEIKLSGDNKIELNSGNYKKICRVYMSQ